MSSQGRAFTWTVDLTWRAKHCTGMSIYDQESNNKPIVHFTLASLGDLDRVDMNSCQNEKSTAVYLASILQIQQTIRNKQIPKKNQIPPPLSENWKYRVQSISLQHKMVPQPVRDLQLHFHPLRSRSDYLLIVNTRGGDHGKFDLSNLQDKSV